MTTVVPFAAARNIAAAAIRRSQRLCIHPADLAAARRTGIRALLAGATVWGAAAAAERSVIDAWHRCGCPTRSEPTPPGEAQAKNLRNEK